MRQIFLSSHKSIKHNPILSIIHELIFVKYIFVLYCIKNVVRWTMKMNNEIVSSVHRAADHNAATFFFKNAVKKIGGIQFPRTARREVKRYSLLGKHIGGDLLRRKMETYLRNSLQWKDQCKDHSWCCGFREGPNEGSNDVQARARGEKKATHRATFSCNEDKYFIIYCNTIFCTIVFSHYIFNH